MTTKKSGAMRFLEGIIRGALTFGSFMEAIRLGENESQAEFGRRLGVSRSHLCDIEKGRKLVSPARAAQFAKVLGYSQDQFVRLALQAMVQEAGLKFNVRVEAA